MAWKEVARVSEFIQVLESFLTKFDSTCSIQITLSEQDLEFVEYLLMDKVPEEGTISSCLQELTVATSRISTQDVSRKRMTVRSTLSNIIRNTAFYNIMIFIDRFEC